MKNLFALFFAVVFVSAAVSAPIVSDVTVSQDQTNKTVVVTYTLSGDGIVTMDVLKDGVSIGLENVDYVTGDANRKVTGGPGKKIFWAAEKSWPGHSTAGVSVELTAWSTNAPPPYMVVDLGHRNEQTYYVSTNALPGGGLKNDMYRTTKLVMRKIPAANVKWLMGRTGGADYETPRRVTLTEDYYMAIYEFTQGQCFYVTKETKSKFTYEEDSPMRPVDFVHYGTIRGGRMTEESGWLEVTGAGSCWPDGGHDDVGETSILGQLRARTGIKFDMPTSAQWEFACRAGNGNARYGNTLTDLGWVPANASEGCASNQTHVVGLKQPNAWGIYDMYGNVHEYVLDRNYLEHSTADVTDPKGPYITDFGGHNYYTRLARGGSYNSDSTANSYSVSSLNAYYGPMLGHGLRLVCPIQ
jgi:formylglycine-generating enzyme required for sulfatase activity